MRISRLLLTTASLTALSITGCPQEQDTSRTSNQGGGNLITAGAKIAGENISALTADEVQVLADTVASRTGSGLELTDEQAADAVSFIQTYDINTIADIEALVQQAEEDPDSIEIPESIGVLIESDAFRIAPESP